MRTVETTSKEKAQIATNHQFRRLVINSVTPSALLIATLMLSACESESNPQRQSQLKIVTTTNVNMFTDTVDVDIGFTDASTGMNYSLTPLDEPILVKWLGNEAIATATTQDTYTASFNAVSVGAMVFETDFETSNVRNESTININSTAIVIGPELDTITTGDRATIQWYLSDEARLPGILENVDIKMLPTALFCESGENLIESLGDGIPTRTENVDQNMISTSLAYTDIQIYVENSTDSVTTNNCQIDISLLIELSMNTEKTFEEIKSNRFGNVQIHGSFANSQSDKHSIKLISKSTTFQLN